MIRPAQHVLLGQGRAAELAFSPLDLFSSGEQGEFWDPLDLSTLASNEDGTGEVTEAQPSVRYIGGNTDNNHNLTGPGGPPIWNPATGAIEFRSPAFLLSDFSLFQSGSVFSSIAIDVLDESSRHYYFGEGSSISDTPIYYHLGAESNVSPDLLGPVFRGNGSLGTYGGTPLSTTGKCILSCYDHDGVFDFYKNGQLVSSVAFAPADRDLGFDRVGLGCLLRLNAQLYGSMDFYGGVYVSRVMSETDIQNVVSWQAARAGITL